MPVGWGEARGVVFLPLAWQALAERLALAMTEHLPPPPPPPQEHLRLAVKSFSS